MKKSRKTILSASAFARSMTDPSIKRPRGKAAPKQNLAISLQNGKQIVDWTCFCGHRNHHLWFGRDQYVCSECEQPTELKGVVVEPVTQV